MTAIDEMQDGSLFKATVVASGQGRESATFGEVYLLKTGDAMCR